MTDSPQKRRRPVEFTPELGERVCARIAEGRSVAAACLPDGMPRWRTFMRWLATADAPREEGDGPGPFDALRQHYARARELRADARFEKLDSIMAKVAAGELKPDAGRVLMDAIKWQTGIENGRRYGQAVTLRGDASQPVEVRRTARDLSDAELAAIALGGLRAAE